MTQLLELYPCGACRRNVFSKHNSWLTALAGIAFCKSNVQSLLALWSIGFHNAVNDAVSPGRAPTQWIYAAGQESRVLRLHAQTYGQGDECTV